MGTRMKRIPRDAVVIIDNGQGYDDHVIYFVDTTGYPEDAVNLLIPRIVTRMNRDTDDNEGARVLGVADLDGWEGGAIALHDPVFSALSYRRSYDNPESFFAGVPDDVVRKLVKEHFDDWIADASDRLTRITHPHAREQTRAAIMCVPEEREWWERWLAQRGAPAPAPAPTPESSYEHARRRWAEQDLADVAQALAQQQPSPPSEPGAAEAVSDCYDSRKREKTE